MRRRKTFSALSLILIMIFSQCATKKPPPPFSETEWLEKTQAVDPSLLYASNVDSKGLFFNPWLQRERLGTRNFRSYQKNEYSEEGLEERFGSVENDYAYLSDNSFDSITYAGHASMIIKMDGQTIFTDPFFSDAALIIRKKVKIKFDYSKVPDKPVVLISHNHYDHLDKKSVKNLIKKDAVFIVPLGLKKLITRWGAGAAKGSVDVHELDWWQSVSLQGIEYTLLPAQHWSRRIGQKSGATLWGSFMIQGSKTIYFSGDSGYFIGFKEFGNKWDIDYAIVGVGAYEPRWFMHYSHLNVNEFLLAAQELKAKKTIPMHFGVISLSDEPLLYPLHEIDIATKENEDLANIILPLRVGEFTRFNSD